MRGYANGEKQVVLYAIDESPMRVRIPLRVLFERRFVLILTFERENNKIDFLRVSPELMEILRENGSLEDMANSYIENSRAGLFQFLLAEGLSPKSIGNNIDLRPNVSKTSAKQIMEESGYEIDEHLEEEIIYS